MRLLLGVFAVLLTAAGGNKPTQNGDSVGSAVMLPGKTVVLRLRSVGCDGTIAEGQFSYRPDQPGYAAVVDRYQITPSGEPKPIIAQRLSACPS